MLGDSNNPGIIPRALNDLFAVVQEKSVEGFKIKMTLTFIEIYNETINDLLDDTKKRVDIVEDPIKGLYLANAKEMDLVTVDDVFRCIVCLVKKGRKQEKKL